MARPAYIPDNFVIALVSTVVLASVLPASGMTADAIKLLASVAIAALFFLHGARLSRQAIVAGIMHWRLHLLVLASTFVLFPVAGLLLRPLLEPLVTPQLYLGVLYLCMLPSTVQSSIALTSMARGNVPAAVCSASASTLLGILITPLLVAWVFGYDAGAAGQATGGLEAIGRIMLQLLLPFVVGHLLQPWIGNWVKQRAKLLKFVDQGSIVLVVYSAFSAAVVGGLWLSLSAKDIGALVVVCAFLLALALGTTTLLSRLLGFNKADEITAVFCGANKSLASGVPMANVLFAASAAGVIVLPLMLYHQMQLMVCSFMAQRWGRRAEAVAQEATPQAR